MKKIILFVFATCFGLTINVFSQPKEISREQFWQKIHAARDKDLKISQRSVTKLSYFEKGKLQSTKEITKEFLAPSKKRHLTIEKIGGRVTSEEIIQIDETYYCRKNNGKWIESNNWCGRRTIFGISDEVSSTYTVEEVKIGDKSRTLYRQHITYGDAQSVSKKGKHYLESKFWLDGEGLIIREENKSGLFESEIIYDQSETIYIYNSQNLKIEAPLVKSESK